MAPEDMVIRLSLACLFGLIIGAERQARHKVAGLRTHVLVSLGACLIMILSVEIATSLPNSSGDPGRLAAQVVSGIGFLGAGAILKEGVSVIGLTTAASLWLIAAIGLATGVGSFFSAGIATAFGFITLTFIGRFDKFRLLRQQHHITLEVESYSERSPVNLLSALLTEKGLLIEDITVLDSKPGYFHLSVTFDTDKGKISLTELMEEIRKIEGITHVKKG